MWQFWRFAVIGFKPDIIHLNDWQAGMVGLLRCSLQDRRIYRIHTLLSYAPNIRDFSKGVLVICLAWTGNISTWMIEFHDNINFMKGLYSSIISTVSHTIEEISMIWRIFRILLNGVPDLYGIITNRLRNQQSQTDKALRQLHQDDLRGKYENKRKIQQGSV